MSNKDIGVALITGASSGLGLKAFRFAAPNNYSIVPARPMMPS